MLKILEGLAAQLTEDGDVTPVRNSRAGDKITVEDFMRAQTAKLKVRLILHRLESIGADLYRVQASDNSNDIFSALTSNDGRNS